LPLDEFKALPKLRNPGSLSEACDDDGTGAEPDIDMTVALESRSRHRREDDMDSSDRYRVSRGD
jgi:hypothetical protein